VWLQNEIILKSHNKGFHLVTDEILSCIPEIKNIKIGLVNLLLKHTSASLTLNENADPDVRTDMRNYFDEFVPENKNHYEHTSEGADDMPAHIKSSLLGNSITIPISNGKLNLGTWQGIYLCEHRNNGENRKLLITIIGET
jgi:secondary thiamine-phosphate synthase enzyme